MLPVWSEPDPEGESFVCVKFGRGLLCVGVPELADARAAGRGNLCSFRVVVKAPDALAEVLEEELTHPRKK